MVSTDIASNAPFEQEAFFGASAKLRKATIRFAMYVRPSALKNSVPIYWIFHEICYFNIFRNSVEKNKFH